MSGGAFFLALLVRSTLWMGLVGFAAVAVRRAGGSAAMRHLVWLFGLCGLAMLPLLALLMPPLALPILPEPAMPAAQSAGRRARWREAVGRSRGWSGIDHT